MIATIVSSIYNFIQLDRNGLIYGASGSAGPVHARAFKNGVPPESVLSGKDDGVLPAVRRWRSSIHIDGQE
jgi:hypothetical protein